jgi:hypothetical protein
LKNQVYLVVCLLAIASILCWAGPALAQNDSSQTGLVLAQDATSAPPAATVDSDQWNVIVAPYLWLSGISGDIGFRDHSEDFSASPSDLLKNLDFGFMFALEAQKGKFVILTDLVYADLSKDIDLPNAPNVGVKVGSKEFFFDPEAGYHLERKNTSIDLLGGVRIWHLSTSLEILPGTLLERKGSASKNWVDPVFGLKLKTRFHKSWFVTLKGDVGGFGAGSDFTGQIIGLLGMTFKERYSLILGYRYLYVDYDKDLFLYRVNQAGPVFGFGIAF